MREGGKVSYPFDFGGRMMHIRMVGTGRHIRNGRKKNDEKEHQLTYFYYFLGRPKTRLIRRRSRTTTQIVPMTIDGLNKTRSGIYSCKMDSTQLPAEELKSERQLIQLTSKSMGIKQWLREWKLRKVMQSQTIVTAITLLREELTIIKRNRGATLHGFLHELKKDLCKLDAKDECKLLREVNEFNNKEPRQWPGIILMMKKYKLNKNCSVKLKLKEIKGNKRCIVVSSKLGEELATVIVEGMILSYRSKRVVCATLVEGIKGGEQPDFVIFQLRFQMMEGLKVKSNQVHDSLLICKVISANPQNGKHTKSMSNCKGCGAYFRIH